MPTTPYLNLPYPGLNNAPNVPADIQSLTQVLDALGAPWSSYTPVWTGSTTNPTLGDTTVTGAYKQIGKTVMFRASFVTNTTFAQGAGLYSISLPVAASAGALNQPMTFDFFDTSAARHYPGIGGAAGTTVARIRLEAGVTWGANAPVALAAGDSWWVTGTYEAA